MDVRNHPLGTMKIHSVRVLTFLPGTGGWAVPKTRSRPNSRTLILSAVRSGSLPPQSKLPYATPQGESNVTRRRNKTVGLASAAAQRVTPPAAAAVQPNVLRRSETPMRNTVPVRPERFAVIAGVTTFPRFTELWCLWTGVPSWQRLCERYLPRVPPGVY